MKTSITNIKIPPGRARKDFTGIHSLMESIKTTGRLLHPIVVTPDKNDPGKFLLIAGQRRFQAAMFSGWSEIEYTLFEDLSTDQQKEMELIENVERKNFSWQEEAECRAQLWELRKARNPSDPVQQQIAEMAGVTKQEVGQSIKAALKLRERPDLAERVSHLPEAAAMKQIARIEEAEMYERLTGTGQVVPSMELRCGDCRELIKTVPSKSVHLLLCDPPYGVEKIEDMVSTGSSKMVQYGVMNEHHNQTLEKVLALLAELAPELARVMVDGSHFYMFSAFQNAGDFIKALSPHLTFQPPIVVWDRGKSSMPGYKYAYMSMLECIIFGYKPPRTLMLADNKGNVLKHPEPPRGTRIYPTEKPVTLLKEIIEMSTHINQTVFDPFAGSGSSLVAAKQCGRKALGFEIDKEAWARAQNRLRDEAKGVKL